MIAPGFEPGTSGILARKFDQWTTDAVMVYLEAYSKILECIFIDLYSYLVY
jgi:hypothetical protein